MKKYLLIALIIDFGMLVRTALSLFNHGIVVNNGQKIVALILFWVAWAAVIYLNKEVWHQLHYEEASHQSLLIITLVTGVLVAGSLVIQPQRHAKATMATISMTRAVKLMQQTHDREDVAPIYFYVKADKNTASVTQQLNRLTTSADPIQRCQLKTTTAADKRLAKQIRQLASVKSAQTIVFLRSHGKFTTINNLQAADQVKRVMQIRREANGGY